MNHYFVRKLMILLICHRISAVFETVPIDSGVVDPSELDQLMSCFRRVYSTWVRQMDSRGRSCWDLVSYVSCWGRCQSYEIPDWRFPFKLSHHPTCKHDEIQPRLVRLKNCDAAVEEGTDTYTAYDALSCRCQTCNSSMVNCEQLHPTSR